MIVACECAGLDQRCDLVTGECTCPATTQGHICDKCVQDYWDWSPRGCKVRSTKCNNSYPWLHPPQKPTQSIDYSTNHQYIKDPQHLITPISPLYLLLIQCTQFTFILRSCAILLSSGWHSQSVTEQLGL